MSTRFRAAIFLGLFALLAGPTLAQLIDRTQAPNTAGEGIQKSLADQIGAGRGDVMTPDSSAFIIARDPFRAIRRGRQLFQRKFTRAQGQGPVVRGRGRATSTTTSPSVPACPTAAPAATAGRAAPRASAATWSTRPDSRDAPHLFGLGLKEMLADEITADLRAIRAQAVAQARATRHPEALTLSSKGIRYGRITALPDGSVDTSQVSGVDTDLRVRPFFVARRHHLDPRVRGGRLQRRDGTAGGRPRPRRCRPPACADHDAIGHGPRRRPGPARGPAHRRSQRRPRR